MAANLTHLKIMTPDGLFLDKDVAIVTVKTSEGNIGLQHGKSPFVASIEISELTVKYDDKHDGHKGTIAAIAGGLVYVTPKSVDIITDAIEWKENIDKARAEKAVKEAEASLKHKTNDADHMKDELALKRALNRISVKRS